MSGTTEYLQAEADLKAIRNREIKAAKTKDVGEPIELKGKVIQMIIRGGDIWTAESGAVARRLDLESGRTMQLYKGHGGPVTSLDFYSREGGSFPYLITGAWDNAIMIWNTKTKEIISTTAAHDDFVKSLLVIPSLKILASGSSDKTVRLWDLSVLDSDATSSKPLPLIGSLSGHRRPIDCIAFDSTAAQKGSGALLYSGDSMGIIKSWTLDIQQRADGTRSVRGSVLSEYTGHRTGVCSMTVDDGAIWSGSSDFDVLLQSVPSDTNKKTLGKIAHTAPVRSILPLSLTPFERPLLVTGSGDLMSIWDVSSFDEPGGKVEIVSKIDAHSHDITGIGWWIRTVDGKKDAWIVSASLDGTIRRWKLAGLTNGKYEREVRDVLGSTATTDSAKSGEVVIDDDTLAELDALMAEEENS